MAMLVYRRVQIFLSFGRLFLIFTYHMVVDHLKHPFETGWHWGSRYILGGGFKICFDPLIGNPYNEHI